MHFVGVFHGIFKIPWLCIHYGKHCARVPKTQHTLRGMLVSVRDHRSAAMFLKPVFHCTARY